MGLDQMVYMVRETCPEKAREYMERYWEHDDDPGEGIVEEVMNWRKHPNLHGWMEDLYVEKGGCKVFNGELVELGEEDILRLREDVENGILPYTIGFFFGSSSDKPAKRDLAFCDSALSIFEKGYHLYYTSSW